MFVLSLSLSFWGAEEFLSKKNSSGPSKWAYSWKFGGHCKPSFEVQGAEFQENLEISDS